jgi:hypothetical protein
VVLCLTGQEKPEATFVVVLTLDEELKVSVVRRGTVSNNVVFEPLQVSLPVGAAILGVEFATPPDRLQCYDCEMFEW